MCYGVLSARNCHDRLRQDKSGLTVRSGTVLRAELPSKQNRSQLKQDKYPQPRRLHHSLAFLCKQTSTLSADCGVGKRPFKGCPWWIFPLVWLLTSVSRLRMAVSGIDATLFSFRQTASSTHRDENVPMTHWLVLLVYKGCLGFRGLC